MNRHQEAWINGIEYDLVHILRGTYWVKVLVDLETNRIVKWYGIIDI